MNAKKITAVITALSMLPAYGALAAEKPQDALFTVKAAASKKITLDPSDASPFNNGRFEGWGTSLCWWANRLGYSEALTQQAANLFFSDSGLSLDIARYNLGGGDDPTHTHITRSDSAVPGYWGSFEYTNDGADVNITYDWTKDANQRNIALAALKANPNLYFEGFSNSAPYFMTNSGCSSGAEDASKNNLRDDMYDDFAEFIAECTYELNKRYGIKFQSYSPMNEPYTSYWGALSPKQEGCHFDQGASESNMINETRKALDAKGLTYLLVAGMDETSIDTSISSVNALTAEALANLGRIDTHTYSGSKRAALKAKAVEVGKTLWMSEVDNGGTAGTNAGDMGAGLNLANRIVLDMNGMQPAAWVMWDIVDFHKDSTFSGEENNSLNQSGGLWGVGMGNHDTQQIELTQKYYVYGQFTKYIEPGDTIIASSSNSLAAYNKDTGDIKIVAVNTSAADLAYTIDLSAFTKVGTKLTEIRTSGAYDGGEHWAAITGESSLNNKLINTTLKANSVTTYIVDGAGATDYALITGGSDSLNIGENVQLAVGTNLTYDSIEWSVSDSSIASITQDGVLWAKASGDFTVSAKIGDYTVTRAFNVLEYVLSGTKSWNNDDNTDYLNVSDGDLATYYDGYKDGYVMYDYGTLYKLSSILYASRSGSYESRSKGSKFQGSYDGINWVDIYTITSALPSSALTEIPASAFETDRAFRYYRYTNPTDYTNASEIVLNGAPYTVTYTDAPVVSDVKSMTDSFEGTTNIFNASYGELSEDGSQVYTTNLSRYNNVFVPVKTTAVCAPGEAINLGKNQLLRFKAVMFAGWESGGKDNTLALKDADGNELAAIYMTGGGYTLQEVRIGGKNVMSATGISQCMTSSSKGANGWDHSSQPFVNNVGFNKDVEITINGAGTVTISFTGGKEDHVYTGSITTPITIGSLELTGSYNTSRGRVVSYDNLDTDLITYTTDFATPAPTLEPTATPEPTNTPVVLPDTDLLIDLDFNNGDLTSNSAYGKAAVVGTEEYDTGSDGSKCFKLNGANYIELTDANGGGLLTGRENLTIAFKAKPTATSAAWWFYAAPNTNTQTYQKEVYLGALGSNTTLSFERYNNSGSRCPVASGTYTYNDWNDVVISLSEGNTQIYVNGTLAGEQTSDYLLSSILSESSIAYIGKANWGQGEYTTGLIDDFKIYAYSTPTINIGDLSAVTSDITLPTSGEGYTVVWTSSDTTVITNDGKVTQPTGSNKTVTLTAAITLTDLGITLNKEFTATVIGKGAVIDTFTAFAKDGKLEFTSDYTAAVPYDMYVGAYDESGKLLGVAKNTASGTFEIPKNGLYTVKCFLWEGAVPVTTAAIKNVLVSDSIDTSAYLFAHFMNTEGDASCEQIYFSVSEDGQTWSTLNSGKPILTSTVGELGVRDPYILRGADGKFFIIATDLSIYNRRGDSNKWGTCQTSGSQSIVIWESDDLVNWSEANLVKVAVDNAGCTWAPEAIYDPDMDAHMVFWASKVSDDNYATQRVYRSYTKDFKTFTPAEIYIDGGTISNIDTTIIDYNGYYYRFTKNESKSTVIMEKSRNLSEGWTSVDTYTLGDMTGYEGPAIYKLNSEDKWCLLLDKYSTSSGYKPFVTTDLASGTFTAASDFTFDGTYRHGTVLPITAAELTALKAAY